jgi:hypothetical protein
VSAAVPSRSAAVPPQSVAERPGRHTIPSSLAAFSDERSDARQTDTARGHLHCSPRLHRHITALSCSSHLVEPHYIAHSEHTLFLGMVYVRRRAWLLCALAAAASLLVLRPFQTAEEPAAKSLPDVEALRSPCSPKMTCRAPEAFSACFATSHGPFEAHCVRRRAPVWVDRVYNLVANGFYDDQRGGMLDGPRYADTARSSTWGDGSFGPCAALRPSSPAAVAPPVLCTLWRSRQPRPKSATSKVGHLTACTSAPGTFCACSMAAASLSCSLAPLATPPSRRPLAHTHPSLNPSPSPSPSP